MKKQIITIVAVAVAVLLLFTAYAIFFRDDGIEEVGDPFYQLTDEAKNALSELDADVDIILSGYDNSDSGWEMISLYAEAVTETNKKFSVSAEDINGFKGVKVTVDDNSKDIEFEKFFKTNYEGTRYAFDGDSLLVNAVLSLAGKAELSLPLRALSGFDTDGDYVTGTGAPFMFPSLDRSKIAYLTINNKHGDYSIYQDNGSFYFASSRAVSYNEEAFSMLTTNCRYVVTHGKMTIPEGKTWASYGLDTEKPETGHYSLMTTNDKDGNYFIHTVYIGARASSGSYYYARYVGGLFKPSGQEGVGDELIQNLTKDFIYYLPVSAVEGSLDAPETGIMKPMLVNSITSTEDLLNIQNVRIDYFSQNLSALVKNLSSFNPASNLSVQDGSAISTIICDKVSAKEYSTYQGGWTSNINIFGGFTSSDGKSTYIDAALARSAKNGEYKVVFGLLRDEANGAYLPAKVTVSKSYDGTNWHDIEGGEISVSQSDKTVKEYELSFTDESAVKYVRVAFDVPQTARTYVVFDEIRIYADGNDAQPKDALGGKWKLVAPSEYISEGMNYSFLDMTNFNNFVQTLASLEGERVVAAGFADNGDASGVLDAEILGEFGLAEPDKHFSFEFDGVVTDVYLSAPTEDGKYYAYSTFTGEIEGQNICATTDVIVELTTATVEWLDWDFVEYLDHSLLSIYIIDIDDVIINFDGNEYKFDLTLDEDGGDVTSVSYLGKSFDVKSFKYLYQSILSVYMQDEYIPDENDKPEEYLRIKINTETSSPEIVFYRVSSSKCYFTVNGEGSYYALVEDVNLVRNNVLKYIAGEEVTRP